MSTFAEAVKEEMKWGETTNGAVALTTTSDKCLDFFGRAGSMRGGDVLDKLDLFDAAYNENADIATKLLFYTRDIRGGYGERDTFNQIFAHLADTNKDSVVKNLWAVLEFGRAKDLYCLIGTSAESDMWAFMKNQFELDLENMEAGKSISLLAKWIATPDAKSDTTASLGKATAKHLGYGYKTMNKYKKKLRSLRAYLDLPEAKMCAGRWDEIEYSKCASKFILKNRKAFMRHDAERYSQFIQAVEKGEATMHMGTAMPCDIIQKVYMNSYTPDLEAMWKSLPDMNTGNALVMVDTSGSMFWEWEASNGMLPGVVAYALGIYLSERNKGSFKNLFMTFSDYPCFVEIVGNTLVQKFNTIRRTDFNGSTNLEGAFNKVLEVAVKGHVANEDMPQAIVVISDMQINCVNGVDSNNKMTFYDSMKEKFSKEGYDMPHVIFWNVNSKKATFHAATDSRGVSLVSGFSPNVFKQVLENIGTTPLELMMQIVNDERYKNITA